MHVAGGGSRDTPLPHTAPYSLGGSTGHGVRIPVCSGESPRLEGRVKDGYNPIWK